MAPALGGRGEELRIRVGLALVGVVRAPFAPEVHIRIAAAAPAGSSRAPNPRTSRQTARPSRAAPHIHDLANRPQRMLSQNVVLKRDILDHAVLSRVCSRIFGFFLFCWTIFRQSTANPWPSQFATKC